MLLKSTFIVALLPLTFASPVPSRTYARSNTTSAYGTDLAASVDSIIADATSGDASQLLADVESAVSGLLKREAAPQATATSTASSDGLLGSLLDPVTSTVSSLLGGILKREAAPQSTATPTATSTASSGGLLGSLLDPVTSTVSSLLGGILKREAAPQSTTTSTTSSDGLLGSLLDPVTSTVSSLLGGILRRSPSVEKRGLLDSVGNVTTELGSDVGELAKGALSTVLKE